MYVSTADYRSANAAKIFTDSLKNTGFAVITHHPIEPALINNVYAEWQQFFASREKHDYLYDKKTHDGYFPFLSENAKYSAIKDLKEFYHIYSWGKYPQNMTDATRQLYAQMGTLAGNLLQWIEDYTPKAVSTELSTPLSQMIENSPNTVLRIINYPPITGAEEAGAVRSAPHEDINLITLLPAATAPGLQVQDMRGSWHQVPCDPGAIVVNVGDMLQMCSQGYYRSTSHQVTNPVGEAAYIPRLSMPLFVHPRDEVRLSPEHTRLSYFQQRMEEIGLA